MIGEIGREQHIVLTHGAAEKRWPCARQEKPPAGQQTRVVVEQPVTGSGHIAIMIGYEKRVVVLECKEGGGARRHLSRGCRFVAGGCCCRYRLRHTV